MLFVSLQRIMIGSARDLRGILQAFVNKPSYMMFFEWLYPKHPLVWSTLYVQYTHIHTCIYTVWNVLSQITVLIVIVTIFLDHCTQISKLHRAVPAGSTAVVPWPPRGHPSTQTLFWTGAEPFPAAPLWCHISQWSPPVSRGLQDHCCIWGESPLTQRHPRGWPLSQKVSL